MLDVRSRAGVIAVTTSAAVLVGLPVVAFGQVPVVEPVVNGVTNTANTIVQAPVAPPSLPAAPAPAPAPAPAAPAPAPQVQLPAPPPAAPTPAAQAPAPQAPAATGSGSAQARGAGTATRQSSGGGKAAARRSAKAADRSAKRGGSRGDRAKAKASGDAGSPPAEEKARGGSEVAIASQEADALPEDANPTTLPFSGLQLALMAIAGLAALLGGMALRRGALHFRRAAS
jgi:hypothetical protein